MKKYFSCVLVWIALLVMVRAAEPIVTNVWAVQKPGTKLVEISYDVSGGTPPIYVSLQVSSNGGTTFAVPAAALSGDLGANVSQGRNKRIVWNAGTDWNNQLSNTVKFRVVAEGSLAFSLPDSSYSQSGYWGGTNLTAKSAFNRWAWNLGAWGNGWIQVDLGSQKEIHTITFQTGQLPNGTTWHEVYVSDTPIGDNWVNLTAVASRSGWSEDAQLLSISLPPSTGRFALILANSGPSWTALANVSINPSTSSAESSSIRVDTRGRNLVSLTVAPAPQAAPPPVPGGPEFAPPPPSNTVAAGGTLQFCAIAHYDDASTEDVTQSASWALGDGAPKGTSLFGGLFTAGKPEAETPVTLLASMGGGKGLRMGSSDAVVMPGLTVRIEFVLETAIVNSQWILNAKAIVSGNSAPVVAGDIHWDMDEDGAFDDKTGDTIRQLYFNKGSRMVAVQVQVGNESATAAFVFTIGATPEGVPQVRDVADSFSEMLLDLTGTDPTGTVVGSLPSATTKLAVVIHGLESSGRDGWVRLLCNAIKMRVPEAAVVAYDWKRMADPSMFRWNVDVEASIFKDALPVREAGRVNGILLAERLKREATLSKISTSTAIHLIGHSAGGFVEGECALQLKRAGFSNLQVTMLDTPKPYHEHIKKGWRTDRYASSWYGGRFEKEPFSGWLDRRKMLYNAAVSNKLEVVTTIYGNSAFSSVGTQNGWPSSTFANAASTPAMAVGYEMVYGSIGTPDANYRRIEIEHSGLPPNPQDADNRHGFAHDWYLLTVPVNGLNNGFVYSNLLSSVPFPEAAVAIPAPAGGPELIPPPDPAPPPLVELDGFTYFGVASGTGGVHTLTESTDAGFWKAMTLPVGSETLRFRYRFTGAGDGDFIAAYWGEEVVLVIAPDTDTARAGFLEMDADVSLLGGMQGNLVFKLVSRGEVNAVAEIDQIQIVLSDDPDGDGLTNTEELALGTNAHLIDTDGDGLSDYDEARVHGTNPVMADSDGDTIPDLLELMAGTNPMAPASALLPRMVRGVGNQLELRWPSVAGRSYSVLRSFDLEGTAFDFVATGVLGTGADCLLVDPDTAVNPRAFYWVLPE